MVDILLELGSWSTTLVPSRQWISEVIWGSILFYTLPCAWDLCIVFCLLFLSLAWNFPCRYTVTKINGTTVLYIGLEVIILVGGVKHTGESIIDSSRKFPRVFPHIGLKFPSDRGELLIEMCFFVLVILGGFWRGSIVGNKWNNISYVYSCLHVYHPVPILLLVV